MVILSGIRQSVYDWYWNCVFKSGRFCLRCAKIMIIITAMWLLPDKVLLAIREFWLHEWATTCSPWSGNYRYISTHGVKASGNYREFIKNLQGIEPHLAMGSKWHKSMIMSAISEAMLAPQNGKLGALMGLHDVIVVSWLGCWLVGTTDGRRKLPLYRRAVNEDAKVKPIGNKKTKNI